MRVRLTRPPLLVAALATIVGAMLLVGRPSVAPAKEHTAACPSIVSILGRVKSTLQVAAGHKLRGSALGAYQVLRASTASMVRDAGEGCGALTPTLTNALRRAAASRTAVDATVELDGGIEAALSLVTGGRTPKAPVPAKLPRISEAAIYGQDCPDLFPITIRLEGPKDELRARVDRVLEDLQARPRCPKLRRLLEAAAPETLAHVVDSIRLDEPDELPPGANVDVTTRCPELPIIVERVASALDAGAPALGSEDAEQSRRRYEQAAKSVTSNLIGEGRCPAVRSRLAVGLARAEQAASDAEAAWALRHSFEGILSGAGNP